MNKPGKKSIADLISAQRKLTAKPSAEEIEKITTKIHEGSKEVQPIPIEKVKRISVNAPISLYLKAKTEATLQDQTLMAYIIRLIENDVRIPPNG